MASLEDLKIDARSLDRMFDGQPAWRRDFFVCRQKFLATARPEQIVPLDDGWDIWMYLAGRSAGKTFASNHNLANRALAYKPAHGTDSFIGFVIAPTHSDLRKVTFEGRSGLRTILPKSCVVDYNRSLFEIYLGDPDNPSIVYGFSSEEPQRLRGPEANFIHYEEMASYKLLRETWDMSRFCLRLGPHPQSTIATTPKPRPLVKELYGYAQGRRPKGMDAMADIPRTVIVRGSTHDNKANLAATFFKDLTKYEGTERGREEIYAEILDNNSVSILKKEWWGIWSEAKWPRPEKIVISLDTALKAGKRNDYTACTVWGLFWVPMKVRTPDGKGGFSETTRNGWIAGMVSAWRFKAEFPVLKRALRAEFEKWSKRFGYDFRKDGLHNSPVEILIEDTAAGIPLVQEWREAGLPVRVAGGYKVKVNTLNRKVEMAHLVSDLFKDKLVWVIGKIDRETGLRSSREYDPGPAGTIDACIEECHSFTGKAEDSDGETDQDRDEDKVQHDDYVDSVTQAVEMMRLDGYLKKVGDVGGGPTIRPRADEERDLDEAATTPRSNPYA